MTLCAWCEDTIEAPRAAAPAEPVSHGICPSCLDGRLAALATPRARPVRPFASAPAAFGPAPVLSPAAA